MPEFRKKPVVIEAVRASDALHAAARDWTALPTWLRAAYDKGEVIFGANPAAVLIKTLEGTMTADQGDWIIRGVQGELYPCKPDIFEATYDAVTDG